MQKERNMKKDNTPKNDNVKSLKLTEERVREIAREEMQKRALELIAIKHAIFNKNEI